MTDRLTVLHLAGSTESAFYHDLSLVYATSGARPEAFDHCVAVVEPGGAWRLGPTFDRLGKPLTAPSALDRICTEADLVVPYMFDLSGMTSYRSLFEDVLGIPVVGSTAAVTSVAADKALTKSVLSTAGLPVPADYTPDSIDSYPVIVKPANEDNSLGVSLVRSAGDLDAAIDQAAEYDRSVMIEEFIDGREIRLAVIEDRDSHIVPPMIEYLVSDESPVRSLDAKLELDGEGRPIGQSSGPIPAICPAELSTHLRTQLEELAISAHRALGCRDYSLFDLRVDRGGNPFILEAGLFWTFGEPSMITKMLRSGGPDPEPIIESLWRRAAERGHQQD